MKRRRVTWEQFQLVNCNKTKAFEDMCRMLFRNCFFDKKTLFTTEHNLSGIEILPI